VDTELPKSTKGKIPAVHLISQKSNRFLTASPQGEAYFRQTCGLSKIKRERGEDLLSPRYTPVSRLSDGRCDSAKGGYYPKIRRTEPYGPWHDDEPEPCGRLR